MSTLRSTLAYPVQQRSKLKRLSAVAIPASAITASLFMAMQNLVEVDDYSPPELIAYELIEFEPTTLQFFGKVAGVINFLSRQPGLAQLFIGQCQQVCC